jgi:hypothetical protein
MRKNGALVNSGTLVLRQTLSHFRHFMEYLAVLPILKTTIAVLYFFSVRRATRGDSGGSNDVSAPRFDDLKGPLSHDTVPHPCFPWRVWKDLQEVLPTATNQEGNCIPACPGNRQVGRRAAIMPPFYLFFHLQNSAAAEASAPTRGQSAGIEVSHEVQRCHG